VTAKRDTTDTHQNSANGGCEPKAGRPSTTKIAMLRPSGETSQTAIYIEKYLIGAIPETNKFSPKWCRIGFLQT